MSKNNINSSAELYQEIETLYLKEHFHSILKFESVFREIDSGGFDFEKIKCLYEIFARTYLELDKLDKAIQVIDQRIRFLSDKDMSNAEHSEDLLIFILLKLEVLQKEGSFKEEYKSILVSAPLGGHDNQILNKKFEIEEVLFMRYVKVNKYILYLILLAVLLVNLDLVPIRGNYLPTLTGIAVVWYVMNYVMNCRVKRLYLRLIRYIYS